MTAVLLCVVAIVAVRGRLEHRHDALLSGQVLLSADGRTLTTPVDWAPCQEPQPQLGASETSGSVAVDLRTGGVDLTQQCDQAAGRVSVTLDAPLGSRSLKEANTGWAITPFPAQRLAVVGYLPAGFSETGDLPWPWSASGARWEPQPFDRAATAGPTWTRFYGRTGRQPSLGLTQVLTPPVGTPGCRPSTGGACAATPSPAPSGPQGGQPSPPNGCASTPVSVGGWAGSVLCETATERAVTWSDGISVFTLVSYDGGHAALSTEELLRVAESLRDR